jgi:hypothetical protein
MPNEVDAWFAASQHSLEDAMQAVRSIILAADARVTESIKWSTPTFSYRGNIASFDPAKKFVSVLVHRGAEIPGNHPSLEGDGRLARTMRFVDVASVNAGRSVIGFHQLGDIDRNRLRTFLVRARDVGEA